MIMKLWRDLKISTKITLGMVTLIGCAVAGVAGIVFVGVSLAGQTNKIVDQNQSLQILLEVNQKLVTKREFVSAKAKDGIKNSGSDMADGLAGQIATLSKEPALNKTVLDDLGSRLQDLKNLETAIDSEKSLTAVQSKFKEYAALSIETGTIISGQSDILKREIVASQEKADLYKRIMVIWGILGSIAGFVAAIFFGNIIAKRITAPLDHLVDSAQRVAEGDLTVEVLTDSRDEVGLLSESITYMINGISNIIQHVLSVTKSITVASNELYASSEEIGKATEQVALAIGQVAQGATEQSRNASDASIMIEQTAVAMKDIAEGVKDNAGVVENTRDIMIRTAEALESVNDSAQAVTTAAENSTEAAKKGREVVEKTVEGMERISASTIDSADKVQELGKSSQQIGEIIEVIDDIAEQTNLLALNAAIEAARAGEHGKGFAVVADEVRKLAERSANATKEIATLIQKIQRGTEEVVVSMNSGTEEVKRGAQLAQEAGTALDQILAAAEEVVGQIKYVSDASAKMKTSAEQVKNAIEKVAATTENNRASTEKVASDSEEFVNAMDNIAAIAEQTAASTEEVSASAQEQTASVQQMTAASQRLSDMAFSLSDLVSKFKVKSEAIEQKDEIISFTPDVLKTENLIKEG